MGKSGESTLRIDEPLHFMFLVAYLITYFCCAYLLFVCFKNCKRLLRRKSNRPSSSRVINVAEVLNNFHSRQRLLRQMQVSVQGNGLVSSEICDGNGNDGEGDNGLQESSSSLTNNNDRSVQANCSRLNNNFNITNNNNAMIMTTPNRGQRIYNTRLNCNYSPIMQISSATNSTFVDDVTTSQMSDLPTYDVSISEDDEILEVEESPPPSYTECVLENNSRTSCTSTSEHRVIVMDNNTISYHPKNHDERDSSTATTTTTQPQQIQNPSLVKIIVIEKTQDED